MQAYIKMEKDLKFGDIEIQKQNFHQHQGLISIKSIDINKRVRSLLVKKGLNISLAAEILKILNLYAYFSQKWVHIEKTFMKLNL